MPNNNQITHYLPATLPSISFSEPLQPATFSAITQVSNVSLPPADTHYLTPPDNDYSVALTLRSLSLQEKNSDNFIQEMPQRERWLSVPAEMPSRLISAQGIAELAQTMQNINDSFPLQPASATQQLPPRQGLTLAERMNKQRDAALPQAHLAHQRSGSGLSAAIRAGREAKSPGAERSPAPGMSPAFVIRKLDDNKATQIDVNKINFTANTIRHRNFYQMDFTHLNNEITERKTEKFIKNKHVVVIAGNSGMSYSKVAEGGAASDWERVQDGLRMVYDNAIVKYGKDKVIILCGGTSDNGICDLSADIAAEKKLRIFGLTSSQAVNYQCLSIKYSMIFVMQSETWEVPGSDGISLMAKMAANNPQLNQTGEFHAFEGGEVTVSELNAARALGVEPHLHLGYAADPEQIRKRTKPGFDPHPVRSWYNANQK